MFDEEVAAIKIALSNAEKNVVGLGEAHDALYVIENASTSDAMKELEEAQSIAYELERSIRNLESEYNGLDTTLDELQTYLEGLE